MFDGVEDVLDRYDLIVSPTLAVPPVRNATDGNTIGPTEINGESVDPLIGWCMTYPINFTGHPAISVPAGFTPDGLPVGLQIIGRRYADESVLTMAAAVERMRPWFELLSRLAPYLAARLPRLCRRENTVSRKTFFCIDAHTCGNPVRVVAGGGPPLNGATMSEKRQHFIARLRLDPHRPDVRAARPRRHVGLDPLRADARG